MRIEAYTQVQQIYKTTKADKNQKKAGSGSQQGYQGRNNCSSQK